MDVCLFLLVVGFAYMQRQSDLILSKTQTSQWPLSPSPLTQTKRTYEDEMNHNFAPTGKKITLQHFAENGDGNIGVYYSSQIFQKTFEGNRQRFYR